MEQEECEAGRRGGEAPTVARVGATAATTTTTTTTTAQAVGITAAATAAAAAAVRDSEDDVPKAFYSVESSYCKHLKEISTHFPTVLAELRHVLAKKLFDPWPEENLYQTSAENGGSWTVFGLYSFGKKIERNCALCPKTTSILERVIGKDKLRMAGFSALLPRTWIEPHTGYAGYSESVLRAHLCMILPEGADRLCKLTVAGQVRRWEVGKWLIFDDSLEHEAINMCDAIRVVLLVDVEVPASVTAGKLTLGLTEDAATLPGSKGMAIGEEFVAGNSPFSSSSSGAAGTEEVDVVGTAGNGNCKGEGSDNGNHEDDEMGSETSC